MNLDGTAVLHGDPARVWSVLTDPAVLARTIPGCESLEQVGHDEYRVNVAVGVGAIRGTYAGEVRLADMEHPRSYVMQASGAGAPGQVRATVTIGLEPDGDSATTVTWSADAVVGGPVAGVGQRMITGVAKRMAGQFFAAVDRELSAPEPVAGVAPEPAAGEHAPTAPAAPSERYGYAGPAPVAGWLPAEARPLLVGAAGGGLLTLIGVLVGHRLGRRTG